MESKQFSQARALNVEKNVNCLSNPTEPGQFIVENVMLGVPDRVGCDIMPTHPVGKTRHAKTNKL